MSGLSSFKGFGSIKTNSRNDSVRMEEVVEMIKYVDKKWKPIRLLPLAPLQVRQIWINIYTGAENKEIQIPRYDISFDPANPDKPKKGVRCPFKALITADRKTSPARSGDFWLFNAIDRDKQEEGAPRKSPKPTKEEAKTGFKDINSETWTPVGVARFTMTMIMRMNELSEDNKRKNKKTGKKEQYDATDADYGFDVKVKYKKDAPGTDKYSIDKVDDGAVPLTKEERAYLVWELTEKLLDATGRMTEEQANEDVKRMKVVGADQLDDDDDDEDDEPKKGKSAKKKRSLDDDDEPKSKKKKGSGKKPFDDEDEDDEPKSKKKKKKSVDDDEDDIVPKKKKKKTKIDDDEDEEPKPKKKKAKVEEKSSKKNKSSKDEAPAKKKKKK
ncbi:MAG: hypothetical protein WC052_05760 [Patescibacteria group bacterium]